jgi:drug/metabolite transporter (DMT)-like permease
MAYFMKEAMINHQVSVIDSSFFRFAITGLLSALLVIKKKKPLCGGIPPHLKNILWIRSIAGGFSFTIVGFMLLFLPLTMTAMA